MLQTVRGVQGQAWLGRISDQLGSEETLTSEVNGYFLTITCLTNYTQHSLGFYDKNVSLNFRRKIRPLSVYQ